MMIDNPIFRELPDQPVQAIHVVCTRVLEFDAPKTNQERQDAYDTYLNILSAMDNFSQTHNLGLDIPALSANVLTNINRIVEFFETLKNRIEININELQDGAAGNQGKQAIESYFFRDQNQTDRQRAQSMLNDLRTLLVTSPQFEERHKKRVLKHLEQVQRSFHQDSTLSARLYDYL